MRLDTHMSQRMEQKMILAPRMIQSMEILQLAIMALQERIEHELEANPVLELRDPANDDLPADARDLEELTGLAPPPETSNAADPQRELIIDEGGNEKDFDRLLAINEDWHNHFNEEHRPSNNRLDEENDKKHDAMVNMAARPQSLQDFLLDQLALLDAAPAELALIRVVVSHIDDNGYLKTPLEEMGQALNPPPSLVELNKALQEVQKLEPAGVGARDIAECLLLQLTPETPHREVLRALIKNHLEDIQHNRLPIIQKKTGFTLETIQQAIEELKRLNPRPGSKYTVNNIPYIVPDIAVERTEHGDYEVRLLDDWMPNVYISRRYIDMYRDKKADPKAKEFLKRKIQAAHWLIEAIEQRRHTLTRVTKAIIQHQRAFLDKGPEFIEPLKMQQIADQVGVHVTTVSRAVDDKWVQTPRGILPLKRFFGGGTHMADGTEVAYEAIQQKMLELIHNENKSEPLSDEDLMHKLNEAGYPVARRTVTKYRKGLKIPSSRQRKVWKG